MRKGHPRYKNSNWDGEGLLSTFDLKYQSGLPPKVKTSLPTLG